MNGSEKFLQLFKQPFKFRFFLLTRLPAVFFSGIKIQEVDEQHAVTTVPYKWLTQNPFKSTYFASLSMAAELSTGLLAMLHLSNESKKISMLVTRVNAEYLKKATAITYFTCSDGNVFKESIKQAVATSEAVSLTSSSIGTNSSGEVIAVFEITWSFKVKNK
ncbi:DUF4442 domain-containing protein [soil metagenome]